MYAKYTHKKMDSVTVERVLKDGHTMFIEDTVKDLNRKSYLEAENKQLQAQLKQEQLCGDQLQEKCDNLRADKMELQASNKRLADAFEMDTINFNNPKTQLRLIRNALSFMPASRRKHLTKNYPNWVIVQKILTCFTNRGGSGSSGQHCKYLGIDPDGYDFK